MTERYADDSGRTAGLARDERGRSARRPRRSSRRPGCPTRRSRPRTQTYGPNKFAEAPKEPTLEGVPAAVRATRCRSSCSSRAAISLFLPGQFATGVLLILLTLLNAFLGVNQEGKAEASVAALQKMMVVQAKVRRGGEVVQVPMEQLVPGDIVNIEAGDLVPADGRILRAATLEIDESALTGESAPVPEGNRRRSRRTPRSATASTWRS